MKDHIENKQNKLFQLFNFLSFRKIQSINYSIEEQITDPKFDSKRQYAVVRDDGKIVIQFSEEHEAQLFSDNLNIKYRENGLKTESKVIHLQKIQNI